MIYKELSPQDFRVSHSTSNQVVDILQDDIATPEKRKRYMSYYSATPVDASASIGSSEIEIVGDVRQVISGLFQTVHDISHSEQTSNPLMDMAFGINGATDTDDEYIAPALHGYFNQVDNQGRAVWSPSALMVNEKIGLYEQMAQHLLGDKSEQFYSDASGVKDLDPIHYGLFLNFKRLFSRDGIKRGTFALRMYRELEREIDSLSGAYSLDPYMPFWSTNYEGAVSSEDISDGEVIITDSATANQRHTINGYQVGTLNVVRYGGNPPGSDPFVETRVGLVFYDAGIVVLDLVALLDVGQEVAGIISTLADNGIGSDYAVSGASSSALSPWGDFSDNDIDFQSMIDVGAGGFLPVSKRLFYSTASEALLEFFIEGSIDDVLDHIAMTRFVSDPNSALSALTFQNVTRIRSMLVYCRVTPDEFNYSNNPTYTDDDGNILIKGVQGGEEVRPFSYVTKIALLSADDKVLATASLSRPIYNGPETEHTFRIRLDY